MEWDEREAAEYNEAPREGHNAWYVNMYAALGLTAERVKLLGDGRYDTEDKWHKRVLQIVARGYTAKANTTHVNLAASMTALMDAVDFGKVAARWADPYCGEGTFFAEARRRRGDAAGVWQLSDLRPQVPAAVQVECVSVGGTCKTTNALEPMATWEPTAAFVTSPNFSSTDAAFVRLVSRCGPHRAPMVAFLLPSYWIGGKTPVDVREELWRMLVEQGRCAQVEVSEPMPGRNMATLRWYLVFSSKSRRNKACNRGAKGLVKL